VQDHQRVTAVVVTFRRPELLVACLDGLAAQTRPVDRVLVVDNASGDGSDALARRHPLAPEVTVLTRNTGGAGGFVAGLALALQDDDVDWAWLMDDDTVPRPEALAELLAADERTGRRAAVLSSTAVWTDGREHPMNTSRTRLGTRRAERQRLAALGVRPVRTASFVSALLRVRDVRAAGLPHADYFIWSDDFEYTGRLLRRGVGYRVAGSVVEHRTRLFGSALQVPRDRFRYDVRNRLWALLRAGTFRPLESALYGGRSLLGWVRTVAAAPRDLAPVALRSAAEALRAGPRPNADVLAADPAVVDAIRRAENARGRPR
jgi:rhamnopyranosyl-N-acetylglucosaminyl-diphospho-decaprenol beta-1,3/1,4-galactofuranosyltransferase